MRPAKTPELAYPVSIAKDGTRRAVTNRPGQDGAQNSSANLVRFTSATRTTRGSIEKPLGSLWCQRKENYIMIFIADRPRSDVLFALPNANVTLTKTDRSAVA